MKNNIALRKIIENAINEDIGTGDITTENIVSDNYTTIGLIHAKEDGVVAGLGVAEAVFRYLNKHISFQPRAKDGEFIKAGQLLARVEGDARAILMGERVALNFLQRMSGIATKTAKLASIIKDEKACLVDTRKTTPGIRMLEKYAVKAGGGNNHRFGLYDAVLIKDNHIKVAGGITNAVNLVKKGASFSSKIEVEVEDLEGVEEALLAKVDIIMLDNMEPEIMTKAVNFVDGRALLEASGGIGAENILEVAKTGVDYISIGALTHSIKSLDISLDVGEMKPLAGYIKTT